jgi:hypothetical protein
MTSATDSAYQASALLLYNFDNQPLAFGTNNTERMRIDSSGNVGIGTSSPQGIIDVVGSGIGAARNYAYIKGGNVGGFNPNHTGGFAFAQNFSSGNAESNMIWSGSAAGQYFSISRWNGTTVTEQMRFDSSGNVGIGTNSPSYKLDVLGGSFRVKATSTNDGVVYVDNSNASNASIINFGTNGTLGAMNIVYGGSAYSVLGGANSLNFYNTTAGPTVFYSSSTERMRIDSSGNVGIGTNSPQRRLHSFDSVSDNCILATSAAGNAYIGFADSGTTSQTGLSVRMGSAGNAMVFQTGGTTERMRIDSSGGLILAGSTAQKATGTTWSNPSDQRLKDNIRDYAKGITELMQVRVREWEYNGKGGTVEGTKGLGVVADEIMVVLPNTVENYEAKLNTDDEEVTAIKKFDATEITWLLVKTVQEQQALITTLTARIEALEAK